MNLRQHQVYHTCIARLIDHTGRCVAPHQGVRFGTGEVA